MSLPLQQYALSLTSTQQAARDSLHRHTAHLHLFLCTLFNHPEPSPSLPLVSHPTWFTPRKLAQAQAYSVDQPSFCVPPSAVSSSICESLASRVTQFNLRPAECLSLTHSDIHQHQHHPASPSLSFFGHECVGRVDRYLETRNGRKERRTMGRLCNQPEPNTLLTPSSYVTTSTNVVRLVRSITLLL